MAWNFLRRRSGATSAQAGHQGDVASLRRRVTAFLALLDANRAAHRLIADLEDKAAGDYVFDEAYLRQSVQGLEEALGAMLCHLDDVAPGKYAEARPAGQRLLAAIRAALVRAPDLAQGEYILPFGAIRAEHVELVGGKNLGLARIQNEAGLPVPCGFAITASAYLRFLAANDLASRIAARLERINPLDPGDLTAVSEEIQALVRRQEVPEDLRRTIVDSYHRLCTGSRWLAGVALRSSAVREDSVASFAGQYATLLNVPEDRLAEEYREIIASKFSTRAIFYFLTKGFRQEDLAMAVVCQVMVPAVASGVIYSVDPLAPESGRMVVNASWGLGLLVVEGGVLPDVYYLERRGLRLLGAEIACKTRRLRPWPGGGVREVDVPADKQRAPALTPEQLRTLGEYALRLERHYGRPQDVEWAVDPVGDVVILQSRALRGLRRGQARQAELPAVEGRAVLLQGGCAAAAGAGSGPVYLVRDDAGLLRFPAGAVLVAAHPSPQLVVALSRAAAVVCDTGGVASHLATLAREFRVPALLGTGNASQVLAPGQVVTVDTDRCCVFAGRVAEVLERPAPPSDSEETADLEVFQAFRRLLPLVVPLRLVDPQRPDFTAANCASAHDLTRFLHQAAMNEMMRLAERTSVGSGLGVRLESSIPLAIKVLDVGAEAGTGRAAKSLRPEQVACPPLRIFLEGLEERPWPGPRSVSLGGFMAVMAIHASGPHNLAEPCLVIAADRYMNFSVRTGYHYSTVEALYPEEGDGGFVRFHFRGGGAAVECRGRRERLLYEVLLWAGFAVESGPEMVNALADHLDAEAVRRKLRLLAHLTVYTKQLDVLLTDDATTAWYIEEFKKGDGD